MGDERSQARCRGLLLTVFLVLAVACNSITPQPAATSTATASSPQGAPTSSTGSTPVTLALVSIPNADMQYYDIVGSTEDELRAELNAKGPVGYDGQRGDATTWWSIRWTWPGQGTFFCTLNAPTVTYQITVVFPRWNAPSNAAPPLISKWNNYEQALGEHEKGHVDFVVAHYPAVSAAIEGATCSTAEAAAQNALQPIRQHDIDYDAQTNHGATQGAHFP